MQVAHPKICAHKSGSSFPQSETLVFGGGLAGLSAGYHLTRAGGRVQVFEADPYVGGLSKTIVSDGFRYDIGGHRFHTRDATIEATVRELLGDELVRVARSSKIYMRGRFFDYPLKPANALFGLGPLTIARALADYALERAKRAVGGPSRCVSLEDWVVGNFGRTLYDVYFREYSEKVWGLDCDRISQAWVAKRIEGLSLGKAVKNAFFKFSGREIVTLLDSFLYPSLGIGRLADKLHEAIGPDAVHTSSRVQRLDHKEGRITSAAIAGRTYEAAQYVSTIPLDTLVRILSPAPPKAVLEAACALGYRDLVIAAVKVARCSVTDQAWIYIPERKYPFGRLHEPKNWSSKMCPPDKTVMVVEYFCTSGDGIWNSSDEALSELTVRHLAELGFMSARECIGVDIHRIPRAYPLFEVGYEGHCQVLYDYLGKFENLHLAGRSGMFQYQNMDHALASGREAATEALKARAR